MIINSFYIHFHFRKNIIEGRQHHSAYEHTTKLMTAIHVTANDMELYM